MANPEKLRTVEGVVVSDKMDKTVVVRTERRVKHPIGRYLTRHSKFHVHDPENQAKLGDRVAITFCRPMSKMKSWRLVEVIARSEQF